MPYQKKKAFTIGGQRSQTVPFQTSSTGRQYQRLGGQNLATRTFSRYPQGQVRQLSLGQRWHTGSTRYSPPWSGQGTSRMGLTNTVQRFISALKSGTLQLSSGSMIHQLTESTVEQSLSQQELQQLSQALQSSLSPKPPSQLLSHSVIQAPRKL